MPALQTGDRRGEAIAGALPEQVRFAFRSFPLEGVHPHALQAAEAAECAAGQGKFWEMHDLLFEKQEHLKLRQLFEYAKTLGLDMARFTAEMDDEIYLQRVREHQRSGDASGVRATPTFFVNGNAAGCFVRASRVIRRRRGSIAARGTARPTIGLRGFLGIVRHHRDRIRGSVFE